MIDWLLQNESSVRLVAFLGMLGLMMTWEVLRPARNPGHPRWLRWSSNLGIVVINTAILRLLFPILAVGTALWAADQQWGWLNQMDWPLWVEVIIALLLLDLAIYLQHIMVHAIPLFWRFHRLHHADLDYDATTGLRFHPLEILFSMALKMLLVVTIGAPLVAVILFEIVLNVASIFNHGNVHLPARLEPWVRAFIVTPDMHRIHHSSIREETNSNYCFSLSIWDRLFGTYRKQPALGHEKMVIGLEYFRNERELLLHRMLIQPALNPKTTMAEATPEEPSGS